MQYRMLILHLFLSFLCQTSDAAAKPIRNRLSDYITHYEPIAYERDAFISRHARVHETNTLSFDFEAYGRVFHIVLKRDSSLFTHDLHVDNDADNFRPFNVYEGFIVGEPSSSVHGFVYDGIFEGRIHTQDGDEYHVESVKQYRHLNNTAMHSVIYSTKDIENRELYKCGGIKAKPLHWLPHYNSTIWSSDYADMQVDDIASFVPRSSRQRRQIPSDKKECHLYVRADWTYIKWADNDKSRALYLLTQHVKRVSKIYKNTDFNKDGTADGYTLNIKRIGVIDTSKCTSSDKSTDCKFKSRYIGVEKYLEIASLENHDKYCLAYVFAHRDFSDGVLGLAWIGEPNGLGGICDRNMQIGSSMKSLNTGIVSNLNYGKPVPSLVTDVTLAHEVGHNFGSQHDPRSGDCSPGGSAGNYIMYPRATTGADINNKRFSGCSASSMWKTIQARAPKCFKKQGEPICGNSVQEKGENCDCGYDGEESCEVDTCCIGASTNGNGGGCRYTNKAMGIASSKRCSPSNGICCDGATCKPFPRSSRKECAKSDDCAGVSICDSNSIKCPAPQKQPDKSLCNEDMNTCKDGVCGGSLCELSNKQSCQCAEKKDFCHVCCRDELRKTNCTVYKPQTGRYAGKAVMRPPGSPCDNYEGYCDILYKCRKVDAEGPLSRIKKLLLSPDAIKNLLTYMKTYWWACVLVGLGLVVLMVAFIVFCSVHTPSSNPNKKPTTLSLRRGARGTRPTAPSSSALSDDGNLSRNPPGYDTAVRQNPRSELPRFEMR